MCLVGKVIFSICSCRKDVYGAVSNDVKREFMNFSCLGMPCTRLHGLTNSNDLFQIMHLSRMELPICGLLLFGTLFLVHGFVVEGTWMQRNFLCFQMTSREVLFVC